MNYEPEYAKGQILVVFKNGGGEGFARDFGEKIGYKLLDKKYEPGDAYIFQTTAGMEREAVERFSTYSEFIDWADFRDIKLETRLNGLERTIARIQDLRDNVELSDDSFNTKLEGIMSCIQQLRPD